MFVKTARFIPEEQFDREILSKKVKTERRKTEERSSVVDSKQFGSVCQNDTKGLFARDCNRKIS